MTYLRTEVTPPGGTVARATAFVSAAHTYRLFVDGTPVDAWPSFSYPDEQYMRTVDLTGAITGGRRSALGVLHRWYGPGQGRPASSPGLLVQLSVWYRDGRHAVFGSDGTWRELPAEWLPSPQRNSDVGDFVEWVDGRAQPQGWSSPGYDASAWSAVDRARAGRHRTVQPDLRAAHRHPRDAGPPGPPAHGGGRRGRGGLRRRLRRPAAGVLRPR